MTVPYDGDLYKANPPGGTQAWLNRDLGTITASDLDPQSTAKAAMINGQRGSGMFGGTTSMDYQPCVFDTSSPGPSRTVNRRSGTSYPDGTSWTPPVGPAGQLASGQLESGATQFGGSSDAHFVLLDHPNDRILTLRQYYGGGGTEMDCYSGGVSPYNGVEQIWDKTPFTGSPPGGDGSPGTGCGLNFTGIFYPEDVEIFRDTGEVRHGLRFILKTGNVSTGQIYPAYKTDGTATPSSTTMKEGQLAYFACTDAQILGTPGVPFSGVYVTKVVGGVTVLNVEATNTARCFFRMGQKKGFRLEDRTTGGFGCYAVSRKSYEMLGQTNRWIAATGGYVSPGLALSAAQGTAAVWATLKVLNEAFVAPDSTAPPPTNQPPVPDFTFSPTSPTPGQSVTFTDTSTDPDGTIASRGWDTDNNGVYDNGTGTTVSRSFTPAGTYTVGLRVVDDGGLARTTTRSVVVAAAPPANVPPVASFTFSPSSPSSGQAVTFTSTSTDSDGTIASRAWDTDGNGVYDNGTGATASKTFAAAGSFTVGLRVTDNSGATATTTQTVIVTDSAPPPPSAPPAAPQIPTSLTSSAVFRDTTVTAVLQADTTRVSSIIKRRATPRVSATDPEASPSSTELYNDATSQAWGNTDPTGTLQVRRPGVDELILVRLDLPAVVQAGIRPWVLCDGLGGGTGTGKLCPIFYKAKASDGTPDFSAGSIGGFEMTVAAGAPLAPRSFTGNYDVTELFTAGPQVWWMALQVGGASNVIRIPRSADGVGERYVDTGFTYNSAGPTPPSSSSVGTKRSAMWLTAGTPGGGPGGGTIVLTPTAAADATYDTIYGVNAAGVSLRDATPYPLATLADTGGPPTPNVAPFASFTYTIDDFVTGDTGRTARFTDTSIDTDGTISLREWDYEGNGHWVTAAGTSSTHYYATTGVYFPRLRVTDDDGAVTTTPANTTIVVVTGDPGSDPGSSVTVAIGPKIVTVNGPKLRGLGSFADAAVRKD